jgi:alkylation response protein AidB-like acyl-CoA dehydrogenase
MDYRDTPEEAAFRAELRAWLPEHAPSGYGQIEDPVERNKVYRQWHRTLYDAGYMGMAWPVEYGGRGQSPIYDAILNEEAGVGDAPPIPGNVNYLGRSIYTYGTEDQKRQYLPDLLSGETPWCQGFSEPEAGSDIASLRTRADLHGDTYVINGQKMWTSGGQFADMCLLLARTDREAPRHRGISCLLVSMKSPGVTVRPIVLADGDPETCEVFWDNVEVPASHMLGQPGQGWVVAMTTFSYERGPADIGFIASYKKILHTVEQLAVERGVIDDPELRKDLARAYVRLEGLRLNVAEQLSMRVSGHVPGPEGSVAKLLWAEAEQELQHTAMHLVGADALTGKHRERLEGYFRSRPVSVYGGTSQIQKNILALQALGLPRG